MFTLSQTLTHLPNQSLQSKDKIEEKEFDQLMKEQRFVDIAPPGYEWGKCHFELLHFGGKVQDGKIEI